MRVMHLAASSGGRNSQTQRCWLLLGMGISIRSCPEPAWRVGKEAEEEEVSVGTEHHLVEASPWAVCWTLYTAEHLSMQPQQQTS